MESEQGDNLSGRANGDKQTDQSVNDINDHQPTPLDFSPQATANINVSTQ